MKKRRVEQRGNKYYLYELEPYWDSEKKQGRQRKTYLGPCDVDGNLEQERRRAPVEVRAGKPLKSVTFGNYDLFVRLQGEMELERRLAEAFGEDDSKHIMTMAVLRNTDPDSLRTVRDTLDTTYLEQLVGDDWSYSSQRLSELLERIGNSSSEMAMFYGSCLQEDDVVVFDTSVLTSSSKLMDMLENGRGTRKTGLPEVNLGLAHSLRTNLPVMMKLYPGSVSDVSTVKGLVHQLKAMGSKNVTLVMDRGYYSEDNVRFLCEMEGVDFLIPVRSDTGLYKDWVTAAKPELENPVNMFSFHGRTEEFADLTVPWPYEPVDGPDGEPVGTIRVLVFNNTERETEERNTFIARVEEAERLAASTQWKGEHKVVDEIFRGRLKGMETLFEIGPSDDGNTVLRRRRNAMTFAMRNFGRIVFVTSLDHDPRDILELYRRRNEDERDFELLKDDMRGGIDYVHSIEAARGMLFIQFIGLSLRLHAMTRMNADMRALGLPLIMKRLRSVTITDLGDGWYVNEVPKKCRDIYEAYGFEPPVSGYHSTK